MIWIYRFCIGNLQVRLLYFQFKLVKKANLRSDHVDDNFKLMEALLRPTPVGLERDLLDIPADIAGYSSGYCWMFQCALPCVLMPRCTVGSAPCWPSDLTGSI